METSTKVLGAVALAVVGICGTGAASAQGDTVKIAFVTDMSGPYSDFDGVGGLDAIRMAVADFGGKVLGKPIEVLASDHQNRADIASNRARQWWDQDKVDLVIGGSNSSASLAISTIAAEKKRSSSAPARAPTA